jgi:hypothetical protein
MYRPTPRIDRTAQDARLRQRARGDAQLLAQSLAKRVGIRCFVEPELDFYFFRKILRHVRVRQRLPRRHGPGAALAESRRAW